MTVGLRIWRQGVLRVEISDRLLRFAGTQIIPPGGSGVIINDAFLQGEGFCFCTMHSNDSPATWPGEALYPPDINIVGNVLSYSSFVAGTFRLDYGVH